VTLEQEERVTPSTTKIVKWLLVVWQLLVLLVYTISHIWYLDNAD